MDSNIWKIIGFCKNDEVEEESRSAIRQRKEKSNKIKGDDLLRIEDEDNHR